MKLSENSQNIFAVFFNECNYCGISEFSNVQIYSRRGSWLITNTLMVDGITFGRHIFVHPKFVWRDENKKLRIQEKLVAHELVHVLQYKNLGTFGFLKKYIADFWKIFKQKDKWNSKTWFEAYLELPHEVEARKVASDFVRWFENQGQ